LQFWPQEKGTYPGLVLLHEWWGLNSQIQDLATHLPCEGYAVLLPNLYVRQGGMVTANAEVAAAPMSRIKESELLQDINSCCEFLNTRDHVKRNVHGVIGFGMGGSLAIRFACLRKRLRAAVSFYGKMVTPAAVLQDLACPLLYHRAGADDWVTAEEVEHLRQAAKDFEKSVEIRTYDGAPHAFCNETRKDTYRPEAAKLAWESSHRVRTRIEQEKAARAVIDHGLTRLDRSQPQEPGLLISDGGPYRDLHAGQTGRPIIGRGGKDAGENHGRDIKQP
jgi:carboxymethylenebutenolidase